MKQYDHLAQMKDILDAINSMKVTDDRPPNIKVAKIQALLSMTQGLFAIALELQSIADKMPDKSAENK